MRTRKSFQILKTYNGYSIVYHNDYKYNPFVIKSRDGVVARYADLNSCLQWISEHIEAFGTIELCRKICEGNLYG